MICVVLELLLVCAVFHINMTVLSDLFIHVSFLFFFLPFTFVFPWFWCSLTSTVHKFSDVGGGQDLVAAEIVSKLATDGDNDGHNQMGKCGQYTHLEEREREKNVA